MGTVYKFQINAETNSIQRVDSIRRKGPSRAYISRDTRRSCVDLITRHGATVRKVQMLTGLTERQILDVMLQWVSDEREKAYRQGWLAPRGPQPPTPGPARVAA